jgi:succinoglycan biosynthesis transport protein ExoP
MYQSPHNQSFDPYEYVDYLRRRWPVMVIACASAVLLALVVSLMLPKQYTATASIIIEPPGGSDARLTTAVSAMYLESLKTYELFGNSETLFARAAEKFHLRQGQSQPLESLQHRVLKVSKVRDTKVLEVSAKLGDPKVAQALAQYIAEETVSMSHHESLASDHDFADLADKQVSEAQRRLADAQGAWNAQAAHEPVESLQSEIDTDVQLRGKVEEELIAAQSEAAEYQQQSQDGSFEREQWSAAQARAALLEKRSRELQQAIQDKSATLAARTARRQALETALNVEQKAYETVAARLLESRATAGTHAEQLRIIDPGTVPERPSSPNISLNVAVALFAALILSITWLSFAFVYGRRPVRYERPLSREMRA